MEDDNYVMEEGYVVLKLNTVLCIKKTLLQFTVAALNAKCLGCWLSKKRIPTTHIIWKRK
jgi:hypothetical protein